MSADRGMHEHAVPMETKLPWAPPEVLALDSPDIEGGPVVALSEAFTLAGLRGSVGPPPTS